MLSLVDLKRVLAAGPGQRIDVINAGNASAARIARALVALANSDGGLLLIPFDATRTHGKPDVTEVHNLALAATRLSVPALIVPLPYVVMDGELPAAMVIEVPDGLPHAYGLDDHYLARRDTKVVSLPALALANLPANSVIACLGNRY